VTRVTETAPAKINLYLHVGPVRGDGLHDLASLFVFTEDGDDVVAASGDDLTLEIAGPFAGALAGDDVADNLVMRAAKALQARAGVSQGARLQLVKNLPVAAGIGGGSADAAAALRALVKMWDVAIDDADLNALAFELGADVPACLDGAPVFVEGAGEKLSPAPSLPPAYILLINPGIDMPTGPVFRKFDEGGDVPPPSHPEVFGGSGSDYAALIEASRNDLEPAACVIAPAIGDLLIRMRAQEGVVAARMSGSGATCFALFHDADAAAAARKEFQATGFWTMVSPLASG